MSALPGLPSADRTAEVLKLFFVEGLSVRAIGRRLSMARRTIRRILGRELPRDTTSLRHTRESLLDPFEDAIRDALKTTPELRAPAMLERLRPLGYVGGVSILRDRLRALRPHLHREAFLTLAFQPGQALQVDWADFGFALPGVPRRVSGFVMALCYSRYLYLEFTLSQAMGTFLRCMERGLRFLGGSTGTDIFDNMKTVVLSHTAAATVFNPKFIEYAAARGFAVRACNVRRGNEKGRVERPIAFVRDRFWKGRRFRDLLDLNVQATEWRDSFANGRIHDETGKVPALVFEHEEKALLKPLDGRPFDTDDLYPTGVTKSFRVTFDRNRYSLPWRLVGQSVLVRADDANVHVYLGPKLVASHARSWDIGLDIEHPSHAEKLLESKPRARAGSLPPALSALGEVGASYFKVLANTTRSIRREIVQVTLLVELFGTGPTAQALDEVMKTGHVGTEYVEYVLRYKHRLEPAPPSLRLGNADLDGIVLREPDLSRYDQPTSRTRDPGDVPGTPEESP
jgi:transposase